MSYDDESISSGFQVMKPIPGTFSPLVRITLEPIARPITTPSIDHIALPSTSTTLGTRSAYAAGAFRVQRSGGSVRCASTSMMQRSRMLSAPVGIRLGYARWRNFPWVTCSPTTLSGIPPDLRWSVARMRSRTATSTAGRTAWPGPTPTSESGSATWSRSPSRMASSSTPPHSPPGSSARSPSRCRTVCRLRSETR